MGRFKVKVGIEMMTVRDFYYRTDFGNRTVHLKGAHGCFYQDHMLTMFSAYANEVVDESLTTITDTDVYIVLVPRKALFRRIKNGNCT